MRKGRSITELHPLHDLSFSSALLWIKPKVYSMRKGRSTIELHPLSTVFPVFLSVVYAVHDLAFSSALLSKKWRTAGIEPEAFSMRKDALPRSYIPYPITSFHWATYPTRLRVFIDPRYCFFISSFCEKNWRCQGSNPKPSLCERDALPLSYIPFTIKIFHLY